MKQKLSVKLIGIIFFISLILILYSLYFNITCLNENLESAEIEKSKAIATSITASIQDMNDEKAILTLFVKGIWLDPSIKDIHLIIKEGDEYKTAIDANYCRNEESLNLNNQDVQEVFEKNILFHELVIEDNQRILRVFAPVHISGQTVGVVQLDRNLKELDKTIDENIEKLGFFSMGFLVLLVLMLFFSLKFFVITPINKLKRGVQSIAKGDFDYEIKLSSKDEFGELASSFNNMAQDLKTSHEKLKKHEKELEYLINQKTRELQLKIEELEKFNRLAVGREIRMIELKREIARLKKKLEKQR